MKKLFAAILFPSMLISAEVSYADIAATPNFPENLIFVAPHPDDIALTFDGLIHNQQGFKNHNNVSMLVFAQSQWTENTNSKDLSPERIDKVSELRSHEERAALNEMFNYNVRMETYGYQDAPIRRYEGAKTAGGGPGGNFSTFGSKEKSIYQELIPIFENKLQTPNCAIFVLMANGYHVDHFIVREAVITAARNLGNKASCQIYFGEDQPYTGAYAKASQQQMDEFSKRLGLKKIAYTIDEKHKMDVFSKNYISQYSDDYVTGIKNWSKVNKGLEDIYLWPKQNYASAPIEPNCKDEFCR